MKLAVVGAGPAGLTIAAKILKIAPYASINIFEKNKNPYGLARYGVAPDQPDVRVSLLNHLKILNLEKEMYLKIYRNNS